MVVNLYCYKLFVFVLLFELNTGNNAQLSTELITAVINLNSNQWGRQESARSSTRGSSEIRARKSRATNPNRQVVRESSDSDPSG